MEKRRKRRRKKLALDAGSGKIKKTMMGAAGRQKHMLRCLGNQICDNPSD